MFKSNFLILILLLIGKTAHAQTIDELSEMSRAAVLAEGKAKLNAVNKIGDNNKGPMVPPIESMGPGFGNEINKVAKTEKGITRINTPSILAIYGVGNNLTAEIDENGFQAKYREGNTTPAGWVIKKIAKRNVILTKAGQKNKSNLELNLAYGQLKEIKEVKDLKGGIQPK